MKKDDLSKILELKEAYSKKIYDKVTAFRPVLVITEKGVSDLVQPFFNKVGVTAIRRLRKSDNMRVARIYGAPRANQMDEIAEEDIGTRAGSRRSLGPRNGKSPSTSPTPTPASKPRTTRPTST